MDNDELKLDLTIEARVMFESTKHIRLLKSKISEDKTYSESEIDMAFHCLDLAEQFVRNAKNSVRNNEDFYNTNKFPVND